MKVFIVEDALQTRKELADLLAGENGFEVVGQAGSVREALVGIESTSPEALVLDISLPDGSGVEIIKFIRRRGLDLCVLVLTGNPYEALRDKCRTLGAAAVLDKLDGLDQVREALLARLPRMENT
jgi:two-component system, NarL family, response regulator DevR